MDRARIHTAHKVRDELFKNYNILFLPSYSPYLNIIELWFSWLKKEVAKQYYPTKGQLIKGVLMSVNNCKPSYFGNVYRRLAKVLVKAYWKDDLI